MKSFFSKRKDGGKSNSDSSLYPPPSVTTRRARMPGPESLDLATSQAASASSASGQWDGKCPKCRKLMSRCLCHEEEAGARENSSAYTVADRPPTAKRSDRTKSGSDKRMLLETLSDMHQSRGPRNRVPLKMTQDRVRERQLRESRRMSNQSLLMSSSQRPTFTPTRSVGLNKTMVEDDDPSSPSNRFTRSYPDAKWRSSTAITSTMRLAHDVEATQPATGPPKNLLAYNSNKPTNRHNHMNSSNPSPQLIRSQSATGNLYLVHPVSKQGSPPQEDQDLSRVWEF